MIKYVNTFEKKYLKVGSIDYSLLSTMGSKISECIGYVATSIGQSMVLLFLKVIIPIG
jgi:hypothetical protein